MKKKRNVEKVTLKERVADGFGASKEIILDIPKIVFIGDREVTVENYKSISEYTSEKIVLEINPDQLKFLGTGLEIKSISKDMLFITGKIKQTVFGHGEE